MLVFQMPGKHNTVAKVLNLFSQYYLCLAM